MHYISTSFSDLTAFQFLASFATMHLFPCPSPKGFTAWELNQSKTALLSFVLKPLSTKQLFKMEKAKEVAKCKVEGDPKVSKKYLSLLVVVQDSFHEIKKNDVISFPRRDSYLFRLECGSWLNFLVLMNLNGATTLTNV